MLGVPPWTSLSSAKDRCALHPSRSSAAIQASYGASCTSMRIPGFSIAHFCSVYSLFLFVYLVISTVHLVVLIPYILIVSVTDCSIHCIHIFNSSAASVCDY